MNDEWRFPNRATPEGSSAYYSVRVAPKALRDDLAALLAWRHQVYAIRDDVSDPSVARIKLQWWREELAQTFAGQPRHPLSQVLQPVLDRHGLPQSPFLSIADHAERDVLRRQPVDEAELDDACDRDLGTLFELIARCHGIDDDAKLGTARRLGSFCALVYLVRDSGARVRRGLAVLPRETLRAHRLSAEALRQREHRVRLPTLLAPAAARAKARLAEAGEQRAMPACIRAQTRILESLLKEIERAGLDVAEQRIGLTPLRKLWLAWRESRRP